MFCGTAFKNKGVQRMLDGVSTTCRRRWIFRRSRRRRRRRNGTTQSERRRAARRRWRSRSGPTRSWVADLLPRLPGKLNAGDQVLNRSGQARAHRPHPADARQPARRDQGSPGRRHRRRRRFGRTSPPATPLCRRTRRSCWSDGVSLPVISMAVEPKTKSDQKDGIALVAPGRRKIPRSASRTDEESADHHLRHGRAAPGHHRRPHAPKREFNVEANVGKPQVAYRETIRKCRTSRQVCAPVRAVGPVRHVVIELSPMTAGAAGRRRFLFEMPSPAGGSAASTSRRSEGHRGNHHQRPAGFPVVDVRSSGDGSYHDVDRRKWRSNGGRDGVQGTSRRPIGPAGADDAGRGRQTPKTTWAT